jgi:hypothetical protein
MPEAVPELPVETDHLTLETDTLSAAVPLSVIEDAVVDRMVKAGDTITKLGGVVSVAGGLVAGGCTGCVGGVTGVTTGGVADDDPYSARIPAMSSSLSPVTTR